MSELSKKINQFFRYATKSELNNIKNEVYLTEDLEKVFRMFYIEKKDINYIADTMHCSRAKIDSDLRLIRRKLNKLI